MPIQATFSKIIKLFSKWQTIDPIPTATTSGSYSLNRRRDFGGSVPTDVVWVVDIYKRVVRVKMRLMHREMETFHGFIQNQT